MEAIPLCYLTSKLNLLCRIQHRFILIASYKFAACFGPFSGHRQTCLYKRYLKEDTVKKTSREIGAVNKRSLTFFIFL